MPVQIFGHAKCKATRAAQRFFSDRRVPVHFVDVTEKTMSRGEIASVARAVGGVALLFDAAGARAKERGLAHLGPDEARVTQLLSEDGRLLVTPVVRLGTAAAVGHDEAAWRGFAERAKAG
jgi:arsenate reductase